MPTTRHNRMNQLAHLSLISLLSFVRGTRVRACGRDQPASVVSQSGAANSDFTRQSRRSTYLSRSKDVQEMGYETSRREWSLHALCLSLSGTYVSSRVWASMQVTLHVLCCSTETVNPAFIRQGRHYERSRRSLPILV